MKPKFIRQDAHKKKRLSRVWRKPRGIDSKKRLRKQNRVIVSPGYGTPKVTRKMHKGLSIFHLKSSQDINQINPKKHIVIVDRKLGFKKKKSILEELTKMKVNILNISNAELYLKEKQAKFEEKKQKKLEKEKTKKPETKTKKPSIEDKVSDDEKKKLEKKEIDKLLTKKI